LDPISQGVVGGGFAQTVSSREKVVAYSWFGCFAGLAPDLDIFIQSATDPLLFLEFHRQFTHALIFIPVGALVVALGLFKLVRHSLTFREAYLACLIGYATHGLLDACTSYGTQLFWPFSNHRVSWNNVSVIDPLFTLPALALVITAAVKRRRRWTYAGLVWMIGYLLLGVVQHERAWSVAEAHARAQGHDPERLTLKPGFANLVLWKAIYEHEGYYYVNAVRTWRDVTLCPGARIEKLDLSKHLPGLDLSSQQAEDVERFRWFSQDYLAFRERDLLVLDMRYSTVPNEVEPMWGIRIDKSAAVDQHVQWWAERGADARQRGKMGDLISGTACQTLQPPKLKL
jgi:inner membrane protein